MSPVVELDQPLPAVVAARFPPSATAWLDWLAPQIDDTMLAEIAAADYGWGADDALQGLRQLRDEHRPPVAITPVLVEVLELIRWSEPDNPRWRPGGQGERGHRMRLFACASLLLLADDRPGAGDEETTLLRLVESALPLGPASLAPLARLLGHRVQRLPAAEPERAVVALCLLFLASASPAAETDAPLLTTLGRWTLAVEQHCRLAGHAGLQRPEWLLGLLPFSVDGPDRWHALAWRLLIEPAGPLPPAAAAELTAIGARLILGEPAGPTG